MVARLADKVRAVLALLGPLGAGSQALLLRLLARFGRAWVFGGAAITVFALVRYRTAIAWVLAVWCAAAWMHAPGPAREDTADAGGQQAPEAPEDPFPGMVWDLIGDAPGVHIKRIVEWLHDTGLDPACTPADVTAGLTRRGIPIRASVRAADGRVNRGVHRDDLDAWLGARSPAPSTPVAMPRSEPATTALTSGVADAATGVATPATPSD